MRQFHIGDILSITTGALVAQRHREAVYDILNYMTGDNLFTHQLPRACRECAPHLLRQHPQLAECEASVGAARVAAGPPPAGGGKPEWVDLWLAEQVVKFGETLLVHPIPRDDHERKDPIEEAVEMVGKDRVVVIAAD